MKILEEVLKDDPLWKEIAIDTLKKAVTTVVLESIKAGIDLWKRERIRHDDYAFQQWKKAREEERKKAEEDTEAAEAEAKKKAPAKPAKKAPANDDESKPEAAKPKKRGRKPKPKPEPEPVDEDASEPDDDESEAADSPDGSEPKWL